MIKCQARYKIDYPSREIKSLDCVSHLLLEEKTFDKVVEGFFLTAAELEQLRREAFESGQNSMVMIERVSFNDYLKQRNRDQALSELVADGEKNGDYDDQAS